MKYLNSRYMPPTSFWMVVAMACLLGLQGQLVWAQKGTSVATVSAVSFENDGSHFKVKIATTAKWNHWTLGNPPRIIVDVSDAVSELPGAPRLFEKNIDSGPVRSIRTSQFANTSADRRVRLTIELSEPANYKASRVGQEVHVLIEDSSPARAAWSLDGPAPQPIAAPEPVAPSSPAANPNLADSNAAEADQESAVAQQDAAPPLPSEPNRSQVAQSSPEVENSSIPTEGDEEADEFVKISELRALLAKSIEQNSPEPERAPSPAPTQTKSHAKSQAKKTPAPSSPASPTQTETPKTEPAEKKRLPTEEPKDLAADVKSGVDRTNATARQNEADRANATASQNETASKNEVTSTNDVASTNDVPNRETPGTKALAAPTPTAKDPRADLANRLGAALGDEFGYGGPSESAANESTSGGEATPGSDGSSGNETTAGIEGKDTASNSSSADNSPTPSRLSDALAEVYEPISDPSPVPRLPRQSDSPAIADARLEPAEPAESDGRTSLEELADALGLEREGQEQTSDDQTEEPEGKDSDPSPPAADESLADAEDPEEPSPADPNLSDEEESIADAKARLEELLGPNAVKEDEPAGIDEPPVADLDQLPSNWDDLEAEDEDEFDPTEMQNARAQLLLAAAVTDWVRGDLEGAYARADRVHRYYPESPAGSQAGILVSEIHHLSGDESMAASITPRADQPDPAMLPVDFYTRLLETLWVHEHFDHLQKKLVDWGDLYPRDEWFADYHYRLGTRAYRLREPAFAHAHLSLVPKGDEREPKALLMRARLFDEADSTSRALELYRELAELEPHGYAVRGLARSADLLFQQGKVGEALVLYSEVRTKSPTADEDAWALYQIGNCHLLRQEHEPARLAYTELVEERPESFWFEFAEERLRSLDWNGELARKIEELTQP